MIKKSLIFLLVMTISFTAITSNASIKSSVSNDTLNTELTSYSHSFSITPANASVTSSSKILAGSIYGGQTKYLVVVSLFESINQSIKLFFIRNSESVYISLNQTQSYWEGSIYFGGSANQLSNLYVQLQFSPFVVKNSSKIVLSVYYSIHKYVDSSSSSNNIFGGSQNILGYRYPSRDYIIGLMILLVGMIPETFVVLLLRKYLRRKEKKISD